MNKQQHQRIVLNDLFEIHDRLSAGTHNAREMELALYDLKETLIELEAILGIGQQRENTGTTA